MQTSDQAVRLGREALQKYALHQWAPAYALFESANSLAPSPVFGLYMARCKRQLDELLAARELYRRVAAEPLAADAHHAFRDAVATAAAEGRELELEVPSLRISARSGSTEPITLRIDGKPITPSLAPQVIELDPGVHRVEAEQGTRRLSLSLPLHQGNAEVPVAMDLGSDGAAASTVSRPVLAPTATPSSSDAPRFAAPTLWNTPLLPVYAAYAVGAAGIAAGAVTGLLAWSEVRGLRSSCGGEVCSSSQRGRHGSAERLADVSTVAFVSGAVGIGAGLVLTFAISRPDDESNASIARVSGVAVTGRL